MLAFLWWRTWDEQKCALLSLWGFLIQTFREDPGQLVLRDLAGKELRARKKLPQGVSADELHQSRIPWDVSLGSDMQSSFAGKS